MFDDISKYLSQFTKDELLFLLGFFEQPCSRTARKAEILSQTVHFLAGQPVSWLFQLPERDLKLLRKLSLFSSSGQVDLDIPEYPCLLAALHLVEVEEDKEGYITVSASQSLLTFVRPFIDNVIEDKERMGLFKAERIALGILNIYGVISLNEFANVVYDVLDQESRDRVSKEIARSRIIAMSQVFYEDECYLVSPFVLDHEEIIKGRKQFKKVRKYASISMEDALSAGVGVPFCAYGVGRPALESIRTALDELGYMEDDIEAILTDIWINSQFSTDQSCAESMFSCVNDKIDEIQSFKEYKRIVETIASYANSTPKWLLKGRKPDDVDSLKLSIQVDESTLEEANAIWGNDSHPSDPLEAFYRGNMAIRHVHPTAPCPCGSGLSYKNCHGKKLS